jgi:hypothetical protein
MHAKPSPYDEHRETDIRVHVPGERAGGEPPKAPARRPIIGIFTRRAFLSKDTGRWHKLTGGRDRHGDDRADERDPAEGA